MELELFSLLINNKTFAKLLKSTIFLENTQRSEDPIEDEKAYPLRRGTVLQQCSELNGKKKLGLSVYKTLTRGILL